MALSFMTGPIPLSQAQAPTDSSSGSGTSAQPAPIVVAPPSAPAPAPAPVPAPVSPTPAPVETPAERPATYTVVSGDSLWLIAQKFNTSVKKLKKLNNLKTKNLKPGQVLQIPPATGDTPSATPTPKPTTAVVTPKAKVASHHAKPSPTAPMVTDLSVSASDFASCPVPLPVDAETETAANERPATREKPAPVAELVTPQELSAADKPAPAVTSHSFSTADKPSTKSVVPSGSLTVTQPVSPSSSSKLTARQPNPMLTTPAGDWGNRFIDVARDLANRDIDYDENWRPPGESHSWAMDCSNTARYIYKVTAGIQLPRTASDQYYYLHLQNKAWDVPQTANGFADCDYLRRNLKPGDLLFWENTYKPERQPPITHVMVFLGSNAKGQWIMAGSQTSRGGEHNRRNGGPDVYVFDPTKPCGGYSTWLGMVHHQGRFCAYGRPLEADKSKLAVAANN
jgi:LysM repeat protein